MHQPRVLVVIGLVILTLGVGPAVAFARQSGASTQPRGGPLLLLSADYGTPQRWSGGAGVLIPTGKPMQIDGGTSGTRKGIEVIGTAGETGARLAAGPGLIANEGGGMIVGLDVRGTLTRTWKSPRGATTDSTYLGAEAGLAISVFRFSAGAAQRVAGPSEPKGTMFTWSAGLQIPLGW